MLAETLKSEIETYYDKTRLSNPLYQQAREGRLKPYQLARFAKTAEYLVHHTPIHLRLAKTLSTEKKLAKLEAFFGQKTKDEVGHDQWARDDFSSLQKTFDLPRDVSHAPSVVPMVDFIEKTIRQNPYLYLPYIFLAEYYTCLMGPPWLNDIEAKCNIPADFVSIVKNHVVLDQEHVQHDIQEMNEIVDTPELSRNDYLSVLHEGMRFYDRIYQELA